MRPHTNTPTYIPHLGLCQLSLSGIDSVEFKLPTFLEGYVSQTHWGFWSTLTPVSGRPWLTTTINAVFWPPCACPMFRCTTLLTIRTRLPLVSTSCPRPCISRTGLLGSSSGTRPVRCARGLRFAYSSRLSSFSGCGTEAKWIEPDVSLGV